MHINTCDDNFWYKKGCTDQDWNYNLIYNNGICSLEVSHVCYCELMIKLDNLRILKGEGILIKREYTIEENIKFEIMEGSTLNFMKTDYGQPYVYIPYEIDCTLLVDGHKVHMYYTKSLTPILKLTHSNLDVIKSLLKLLRHKNNETPSPTSWPTKIVDTYIANIAKLPPLKRS